MAGVGGEPPGPALTPVGRRGGGPWAWIVVGLVSAVLVALIGISVVGRSGAGPGSQAAVSGPAAVGMATAAAGDSPAATPVPTSTPTAPPTPPPVIPPPRVAVALAPVATCPPGSTPDEPGPVDQARPPLSAGVRAFDRRSGRIVLVAPTTADEAPGVETWTFDVCTNTWARTHPNREPPSFDWVRLVYDVDSDVTIGVSSGNVWAYDLQTNTWTEKGGAPAGAWLSAYDPDSGLVLAGGAGGPWNYDVETDTWTPIQQTNAAPAPGDPVFAYDASVDRLVAYSGVAAGRHETWLFDIRTGTWSRSGAVTPHVLDWWAPPAIVYDEAEKRTVVGGNVRLAAYDATADRWETVDFPHVYHGVALVYDPVNERLVLFPDSWEQWGGGTDTGVVAFDVVTREWTVLLEASPAQPAP